DGRAVDFARPQCDGRLEIAAPAFALQPVIGHDADRSARAHAIDPYDLAAAVGNADQAELRIGRFGVEVGDKARGQAIAPQLHRRTVDRMDATAHDRADQA